MMNPKPSEGPSAGSSASTSGTKLNPFAREWDPKKDRAPEEDRGLYLTFSKGFPLYEREISQFFNRKFGRCVERVYVYRRNRDTLTLCAKVVFCFSHIPLAVLGKENEAKFVVNAKTMWCKRYEQRRNRN